MWDSSRLPRAAKRRLLELFVLGVPVYRMRFRVDTSLAAIEGFFRLARARPSRKSAESPSRVPWSATRPRLAGAGRANAVGVPQAKSLCSAFSRETARFVFFRFKDGAAPR